VAVFVHGCFWHGHDCHLFRMPSSRKDFWREKICRNRERDTEVKRLTLESRWRHLAIWECAFRGEGAGAVERTAGRAARWIRSHRLEGDIRGTRSLEH
jgi:DNA mismatch endonuclease (patch repair protein)